MASSFNIPTRKICRQGENIGIHWRCPCQPPGRADRPAPRFGPPFRRPDLGENVFHSTRLDLGAKTVGQGWRMLMSCLARACDFDAPVRHAAARACCADRGHARYTSQSTFPSARWRLRSRSPAWSRRPICSNPPAPQRVDGSAATSPPYSALRNIAHQWARQSVNDAMDNEGRPRRSATPSNSPGRISVIRSAHR